MQYKQIISSLNQIEDNVPVGDICYKNIKIWPIIRLELWRTLQSDFVYSSIKINQNPSSFKEKIQKIKEEVIHVWSHVAYMLNPNTYKEVPAVFFIARFERTVKVDGKYFSRFSNSLQEILGDIGIKSITLDLSRKKQPIYGNTYYIDREIPSFFEWILRIKNVSKIEHWKDLENYLEKNFPNIKLDEDFIIKTAQSTFKF